MILLGYISAFLYAIVCILVSFWLNKMGLDKKYTRKIVHISVGFEWVILYHFMGESFHFLVVCLLCLLLLFLDYRAHIVPSLSSDGDNAPGTVYYGLAMSIMATISLFLPDMLLPFGVGVIVTSLGDGMAGVVGQLIKRRNPRIYGNKTLLGTVSTLLFSFFGILIFKAIYSLPLELWQVLLVSVFATALEVVSTRGLDNITITLGAAFLSYFLIYHPSVIDYILPILLTPIIIAVVLSKRVLTARGVIFAVALDVLVSLAFGNAGFLVLLVFLFLSVVSDKIKGRYKGRAADGDKHGARNEWQVFANGIVSATTAVLFLVTKQQVFCAVYIAAVAEAFADTVASGLGIFAKNTYDVFRFRKCEKGISGGMSLIGTASSLIASILLSTLASLLGMTDILSALWISLIAFSGMIFDSLLGSLLQVKYKCRACGQVTEQSVHCGESAEKYRGVSFIDNNMVNIMANLFTAILAFLLFF